MKLSDTSARVLCGIAKNPNMSMKELSEITGVSAWSVYKSLEKMKKMGIFREVYIPNLSSLGFELLVAGYGSLTKRKMHTIDNLKKMRRKNFSSRIFYAFAESYKGFVLAVAKSYTDFVHSLIYAEKSIGVRDLLRGENVNIVFLPLSLTKMPIFFDYSPLLCRYFGVEIDEQPREKIPRGNLEPIDLKVMLEILKNPDASNSLISKKMGISMQKTSKIRKKLIDEGFLVKRIIPNMKLFGYEVLVFAHWFSNPAQIENIGAEDFKKSGYDLSNIVFLAYTPMEGIAIALFRTLQESREIVSIFEGLGEKMGILIGEPNIIFLSLQEGLKIRDHEYHFLIEELLSKSNSNAMRTSKATP